MCTATKVCSKCRQDLPVSRFSKNKRKKDGLCSACKICRKKSETKIKKSCLYCQSEYETSDKRQKFCTHECSVFCQTGFTPAENGKKICKSCKSKLSLSSFGINKAASDGYSNRCLECARKFEKRYESNCDTCGTKFYGKRDSARFCSHSCFGEWFSKTFVGENHSSWKPEIDRENPVDRRSAPGYTEWHSSVFERDDYTCQCCGERGGRLNAHHIHNYADHPDLRIDLDNGITFCKGCHDDFHRQYGQRNTNESQLNEFLENHKYSVFNDLGQQMAFNF